jgi:hypothetical protein
MKFYKDKFKWYYWDKILVNKLTAVYIDTNFDYIIFYKNGKEHNSKNAAHIHKNKFKQFYLNGFKNAKAYKKKFTKQSWRRFVKLQAFL